MCPCCGASLSNNKGPRSNPRYLLYLQCQFVAKVNVDDWLKKIMVEAHTQIWHKPHETYQAVFHAASVKQPTLSKIAMNGVR